MFGPSHYLALIAQKTNELDQAAPLADWKLPDATTPPPARGPHGKKTQVRDGRCCLRRRSGSRT